MDMLDPNLNEERPALVNGRHHGHADLPPAAPSGAVLDPPGRAEAHRPWFLESLWSEFRLAGRMYFDPRYRISRTMQLVMPAILVLFVANYLFFSVWLAIPVISPFVERLVCVLLGIFAYKLLTRELDRYRAVLDYLGRYASR
jgi:hypothetical protein